MRAAPQILLYLASFVAVFLLGNFLGQAFWQAGIHARHTLDGRPLPPITEFFVSHYHLLGHLFLLPWLGLVGTPLLSRSATKDYWDAQAFCFRYLVFLSAELFLFVVLLFFLTLPFVPSYIANPSDPQSAIELVVRLLFWLGVALTLFLAIRRIRRMRKS